FENTGFTGILDVKKRLREVSVDGCEIIGQGGNGTVYRIDRDTIIKVFRESASLEKIDTEKKYAQAAFMSGIPTAISFDTVKVGNCYGIVFEMLDAKTVGKSIMDEPDKVGMYGEKMAELMKLLHTTEMEPGVLPEIKDKISGWIDFMADGYIGEEDIKLMRNVLKTIPDCNTVLHSDFHEGNIMVQDGELVLIDLDDICIGHPIFDLAFNYMSHVVAAQSRPEVIEKSLQITPELALEGRRVMMETYFETKDKSELIKYDQILGAFTTFMLLVTPAKSKDSSNMTPETISGIVETIIPMFREVATSLPSMIKMLFKSEEEVDEGEPLERRINNSIYQVALLQSLMQGEYDGVINVEKLVQYGDIGIGTFEGVNGEMIVLDGVAYQALGDGTVIIADDKETVPFANVTFFTEDIVLDSFDAEDMEKLKSTLDTVVEKRGTNQFYVANIFADFDSVQVRSSIKQDPPYRYLNVALAADQRIFSYENVQGNLVALYCPPYMEGLNMPGWHFHFISSDKKMGGHVLGVALKNAQTKIDVISSFKMIVPDRESFNQKKLQEDMSAEIREAEE
ncbi:MAG: acetolactate decarboxylase, partial [Eubacterium sp.]|nr:acetolactate decarboxylase [Eubacterium sp.]